MFLNQTKELIKLFQQLNLHTEKVAKAFTSRKAVLSISNPHPISILILLSDLHLQGPSEPMCLTLSIRF